MRHLSIVKLVICVYCMLCAWGVVARGQDAGAKPQAAEDAPEGVVALVDLLGQVDDASFQLDLLKGINDGLKGRRSVAMPAKWPGVYKKLAVSNNEQVREQARKLALVFGDPAALASLRKTLQDDKAPLDARRQALQSLLQKKAKGLAPVLHALVSQPTPLRLDALRALAAYDHDATPGVLLKTYDGLSNEHKQAALNTLASRVKYARVLVAAVADKRVPIDDVPTETIRKLRLLKDDALQQQVAKLWTITRATPAQKQARIDALKKLLSQQVERQPDLSHGRALYKKTCAQCHVLFDDGGKVGPDLTGSGRANLDYILLNIVDPQATVGRDYFTTVIETEDGQQVIGLIAAENANAVTVRTANGEVLVPKTEIVDRGVREMSMMPEGLLDRMKEDELRDLIAYLASPVQVKLPPPPAAARDGGGGGARTTP